MDYLLLIVSSALYSVFMMLGGMLLPFAAGLVAALSAGKREKLFVNPKKRLPRRFSTDLRRAAETCYCSLRSNRFRHRCNIRL